MVDLKQVMAALADAHRELLHAARLAEPIVQASYINCGCTDCELAMDKLRDAIAAAEAVLS